MSFQQLCEKFGYQPKGRPLSSAEVAEFLGVHPVTVDAYRVRGDGPVYFSPKGSRRIWYAEPDVLAWLASGERQQTDLKGKVPAQ